MKIEEPFDFSRLVGRLDISPNGLIRHFDKQT